MSGKPTQYVIVGNGITGTTAAETIKKNDPHGEVTLIGLEPHPLYNRVALPRLLRGQIPSERVFMRTVEQHTDKSINLKLETIVTAVNVEEKTVQLHTGREIPYDKLLLATGGRPNRLSVPGADAEGIFPFQTLDDTEAIIERVMQSKSAMSVGGSYISYELTDGFAARKVHTTWLIRGDRFLRRVLDDAGGELVDRIARRHGVDVIYGEEVAEVLQDRGEIKGVRTTGGKEIETDVLAAGLGLTLNTDFLDGTGIELGKGIITDSRLRTNVPDIFAGGDVAEFFDVFLQGHNIMGTWNNSQGHGRVVARNMMGADEEYSDVPHYSTTMFHTNMTAIGMTPETKSDLTGETYVNFENDIYRRLFFDGDRLVGAVLIGDIRPRRTIVQAIRSGEPIDDKARFTKEVGRT